MEYNLGNKVIVAKGSAKEDTVILEGLTVEVTRIENTIVTIEGTIGGRCIERKVVSDGRDGTELRLFTRKDRAKEVQAELEHERNKFEKLEENLQAEITRLHAPSDDAYEATKERAKILEVLNEVLPVAKEN